MKFKEGDILEFKGVKNYAAKKGAKAICVSNDDYLYVEWIRNGDDNDQGNGGYHTEWFIKCQALLFFLLCKYLLLKNSSCEVFDFLRLHASQETTKFECSKVSPPEALAMT